MGEILKFLTIEISSESQQSHISSRRQMESSHGWIEMSFNGFSCYVNSSVVSPLFIISVSQLPPGLKFLAEMNKKPPA